MMLGRYVDAGIDAIAPSSLNGDLVSSGVALLAIIGGTVILFSERELASRWARSSSMPKTAATPLKKGMRSSIAAMPSRKKKAYRRASKKFCCCSHNTKRFPISKMSSS